MTSNDENTQCRRCSNPIPARRLDALPDTTVCLDCSAEIGGEYELKVTMGSVGAKRGSLKLTGQKLTVKRVRKVIK